MEVLQGLICVWVAVAIISALFGAALGDDRGRGGYVGAVFGIVFGPLGVMMVLLLGRSAVKQAEYQRDVELERTRLAEKAMQEAESAATATRRGVEIAAVIQSVQSAGRGVASGVQMWHEKNSGHE